MTTAARPTKRAEDLAVGDVVVEQRRKAGSATELVDVQLRVTRVEVDRYVNYWLDATTTTGEPVMRTLARGFEVWVANAQELDPFEPQNRSVVSLLGYNPWEDPPDRAEQMDLDGNEGAA